MSSEWMKVMLEEIARKQAAAEQEALELARRGQVTEPDPAPDTAPGTRVP